ncbi:MAG: isoleucine--tRNA ligase [Verrucomicrobia bacterium]|nr:isoleucine--tRNA ligase [Verrucomicrobiota bacterium]
MFEAVDPKSSFSGREEKILAFWQENGIFEKSVEATKNSPLFATYDGPPFATGLPHYGHLLAGTIKDVVPRYKTMKGFHVPRRFGWDCHGLPVENEIEKAKGLSGAASIEEFGVANFNEECRSIVLRYSKEWKSIVQRTGRWVDFSKTYHTMDLSFMETVWWVFKELYKKGLVYEGYRVMPYSWKLGTPLSNFEAGENYKETDDPSVVVTFPLLDEENVSLLAWTTTPWTLISNLAVIAGPDIDYVLVQDPHSHHKYILAESRLAAYFKHPEEEIVLKRFKGRELEGKAYKPAFSYFSNTKNAFKVIVDEFVTVEDGTGLVHAAPGFGEADFYACQRKGIPVVCPVDQNGQFTQEVPEYKGRMVKECDKEIIRHLKQEGRILKHDTIRHRYPFCWRSDTPLIYKAMSTWFVSVEKIKDKLLAANEQIYWMPGHIKHGRFGKWLEGARDWNISRNRYWGTPIPLWRSEDGELLVVGSIKELEELTGHKATDLHRHFIDHLEIKKDGKVFKRIPEVFDCWFESGSMPYAQNHYPFENQKMFEESFPADFIAEGLDQTRGWFYTLTILSAALFNRPAFKNVIVNGIVLAADGQKMSKRLKNYPDPEEVIKKYGADAVRLYMLNSNAVKADDMCFSEAGVELVLKQVLIPLWNAYSFFLTYARLYNYKPKDEEAPVAPQAAIDRWILSLTQKLVHDVETGMDAYDLSQSVGPFVAFIEQLTNWYIRRSRRRFWSDEDSPDRQQAFQTLYTVLIQLSKVIAPFVPFVSDSIYRNLKMPNDPESVHLCRYPAYHKELRDEHLEQAMDKVQQAVSLGHGLRKIHEIKVRQPLRQAYIISANPVSLALLKEEQDLIADELNVQKIVFSSDESQFVTLMAKPNFRVLGKKVGKLMNSAHKVITELPAGELSKLMNGKSIQIMVEGQSIELTADEVQVERKVKEGLVAENLGDITVALDTELDEELLQLGLAREIVNKLNLMRKEQGLDIADRIAVTLDTTDRVKSCIEKHTSYISPEVLALSFSFGPCAGSELDLNGERAVVALEKRQK